MEGVVCFGESNGTIDLAVVLPIFDLGVDLAVFTGYQDQVLAELTCAFWDNPNGTWNPSITKSVLLPPARVRKCAATKFYFSIPMRVGRILLEQVVEMEDNIALFIQRKGN